jgi:hypothetical protein
VEFADEPYVRLYTRDTKTWLRLGFEGQTVLMFLLRKLDRAGVLDGIEEPASDVALITGVPTEIVRIGLERLLERRVFEIVGDRLVMPNFLRAQSAIRSDKARQRDMRDKRLAAAKCVTQRDEESREPTPSHAESHGVTPSIAYPNTAQPSLAGSEISSSPPAASVDPSVSPPSEPPAEVRAVFATWQRLHGHSAAKLDPKRQARIKRALKLFPLEQLEQALRGALRDDWLMGRDPKSPRKYDGLETLLRDTAQIERLIALERAPPSARRDRFAPYAASHKGEAMSFLMNLSQQPEATP